MSDDTAMREGCPRRLVDPPRARLSADEALDVLERAWELLCGDYEDWPEDPDDAAQLVFEKLCDGLVDGYRDVDHDAEAKTVEQPRASASWQPIETAPRDGTEILIARKGKRLVARFDARESRWCGGPCPYSESDGVTHWMPLPSTEVLGG